MYTLNEIKPRILLELEKIDKSIDRDNIIKKLETYDKATRHYFIIDLCSLHKMTDLEKIESFIEIIINENIHFCEKVMPMDETIRRNRIKNLEHIQKVLFDTINLIKKDNDFS